jgi:hypothetical protein
MSYFSKKSFSNIILLCLALCSSSIVVQSNTNGLETKTIVKNTEMRLAGRQKFSVTKKPKSGVVEWRVDRKEIGEVDGKIISTQKVATATGVNATFDLPKIPGKETVYHISTRGRNFEYSQNIQVFEPDVPSSFLYKSAGNPDVQTFIVVPRTLSAKTRVIVVMSGLNRNADEYINSWKDWVSRNDYIAVSPTFDEENWGGSRGYNLGNVFTGDEGKGALNPRSKWSFTVVEGIHEKVRDEFGIADQQFDIFGHSAGAQFVHRFLLFNPQSKVRYAIAGNAGWYTLPDLDLAYSYGLKHPLLSFTRKDLINWTNQKLILMRGTSDTSREGVLRKTAEADAQGKNRFERAAFMFEKIKALNPKTGWQLIDVENVGHDQRAMSPAAQDFLQKAIKKN